MSTENRSLIMRVNRLLGATLVEHNLVKIEDLENANEHLLEALAAHDRRKSSIFAILAYDMKAVREEDVLNHLVESEGIGLVDLRYYDVPDEAKKTIDPADCWATWTVPFDREENFYFMATAYYLSPAVRTHWEKKLGGRIIWYGTTLDAIADFLEKHETEAAQHANMMKAAANS